MELRISIIIAGSRDFNNYDFLKSETINILKWIKNLYPNILKKNVEIISGCANGADKLGEKFANDHEFSVVRFPADWETHGKQAGFIRNAEMADYAVRNSTMAILIAFHKDNSKGTAHMIETARKNKMTVFVIRP